MVVDEGVFGLSVGGVLNLNYTEFLNFSNVTIEAIESATGFLDVFKKIRKFSFGFSLKYLQ